MNNGEKIERLEVLEVKKKKDNRIRNNIIVYLIVISVIITLAVLSHLSIMEGEKDFCKKDSVKDIYSFKRNYTNNNYSLEENKSYDTIDIKKVCFSKSSFDFILAVDVVGIPQKSYGYVYMFFLNMTEANYTIIYMDDNIIINISAKNDSQISFPVFNCTIENHTIILSFSPPYPGSLLDNIVDMGVVVLHITDIVGWGEHEKIMAGFFDFAPDNYPLFGNKAFIDYLFSLS